MKLNYRILILTFFAFSNLLAYNPNDETGSLSGKVLDLKQQPIIGASVVLKGTVRGVATNDKGEFTLKNVEIGTYTLVISSIGSQTQEKIVEILRGQTTTIDFQLVENDLSLRP